jgi:hypothetical protein
MFVFTGTGNPLMSWAHTGATYSYGGDIIPENDGWYLIYISTIYPSASYNAGRYKLRLSSATSASATGYIYAGTSTDVCYVTAAECSNTVRYRYPYVKTDNVNLFGDSGIPNAQWWGQFNCATTTTAVVDPVFGVPRAYLTVNEGTALNVAHYINLCYNPGGPGLQFHVISGIEYTISLYIKKLNRDLFRLGIYTLESYILFNLTTGAITSATGTTNSAIDSLGGDQYRVQFSFNAPYTAWTGFSLHIKDSGGNYLFNGNGLDAMEIFGCQIEVGTPASDLQETFKAGKIVDMCTSRDGGSLSFELLKPITNAQRVYGTYNQYFVGNNQTQVIVNASSLNRMQTYTYRYGIVQNQLNAAADFNTFVPIKQEVKWKKGRMIYTQDSSIQYSGATALSPATPNIILGLGCTSIGGGTTLMPAMGYRRIRMRK